MKEGCTRSDNSKKKQHAYLVSSAVNLILPPLKLTAGICGHSSALIADAINSISDVIANTVVYIFLRISSKPRDREHSYGHGKYETIASLFISLMMIVAGILIFIQGIGTLHDFIQNRVLPDKPSAMALIMALFTVVVKEITYRYTYRMANETRSEALLAQAYDHRYDIFAALAVFFGVIGARTIGGTGRLLEPLAAMIVAAFIIRAGIQLARPSLLKLTDATVPEEVIEELKTLILSIPDVEDPHNFRTRMIGSDTMAIELDIRMNGDCSLYEAHDKTIEIEKAIRDRFGEDTHIIIHTEPKHPYLHPSTREEVQDRNMSAR